MYILCITFIIFQFDLYLSQIDCCCFFLFCSCNNKIRSFLPNLAKIGQNLREIDNNWQKLAKTGKNWQKLAEKWPVFANYSFVFATKITKKNLPIAYDRYQSN